MILQTRFLFLIVWAVLSLSCASTHKNTEAVAALNEINKSMPVIIAKSKIDARLILADNLIIQENADFPTQVNVIVSSFDCRIVVEVLREQIDHQFIIQLRSDINPITTTAPCQRQDHLIPLPLMGLNAGSYTVKIHQLQQTFELYNEQIEIPPTFNG